MAYPGGYWAELVRSTSSSSLVESAAGTNVWLRTSDGLPLEQQLFLAGGWRAIFSDLDEPDYLSSTVDSNPYRFRKTGEDWLPDANGLRINTINWGGKSTYRFFESGASPEPLVAVASLGEPRGIAQARPEPLVAEAAIGDARAIAQARPEPLVAEAAIGDARVIAQARPEPLVAVASLGEPQAGLIEPLIAVALLGNPRVIAQARPEPLVAVAALSDARIYTPARPESLIAEAAIGDARGIALARPERLVATAALGDPTGNNRYISYLRATVETGVPRVRAVLDDYDSRVPVPDALAGVLVLPGTGHIDVEYQPLPNLGYDLVYEFSLDDGEWQELP